MSQGYILIFIASIFHIHASLLTLLTSYPLYNTITSITRRGGGYRTCKVGCRERALSVCFRHSFRSYDDECNMDNLFPFFSPTFSSFLPFNANSLFIRYSASLFPIFFSLHHQRTMKNHTWLRMMAHFLHTCFLWK